MQQGKSAKTKSPVVGDREKYGKAVYNVDSSVTKDFDLIGSVPR